MKRIVYFATFAALASSYGALAAGAIANVTIVDRDSGVTLSTHFFRGEYWVAGTPGARYAIEVRNGHWRTCAGGDVGRRRERPLGATAAGIRLATCSSPASVTRSPGGERLTRKWRPSTFTDSPIPTPNAPAAANVGVIGVALFRERRPQPVTPAEESHNRRDHRSSAGRGSQTGIGSPSTARAAADQASPVRCPRRSSHGPREREYSYVENHRNFLRMQPEPKSPTHTLRQS